MPTIADAAPLLFPLLAAMLYAIAAVALKAASNRGCGTVRTMCVSNWITALAFQGFYDWSAPPALPEPVWPVLMMAGFFVLGQLFTILAFTHGEVSVATPVLGAKVILVAVMVAFVAGGAVAPAIWAGGVLCALGVACLRVNDQPHHRRRIVLAVVFASLAAGSFAAFDTTNHHWSPILGFDMLVPPAMLVAGVATFGFLPLTRGRWRDLPREAVSSLAIGAALIALQSLVLIWAIGFYTNAPSANVVYGSRGLWGVAFVWLIGHRFGNTELAARHRKVLLARIAGAALITTAIALAFIAG